MKGIFLILLIIGLPLLAAFIFTLHIPMWLAGLTFGILLLVGTFKGAELS